MKLAYLIKKYGTTIPIAFNQMDNYGFNAGAATRKVVGYLDYLSLRYAVNPTRLILYTQEVLKEGEHFVWDNTTFAIKKKLSSYKYLVSEVGR